MKLQLKPLNCFLFLAYGLSVTACVSATVDPEETGDDTVAPGDGDGDGDGDATGGTTGSGGALTASGGGFGTGGSNDEPLPVEATLPMVVTEFYAASGFMGMDIPGVVNEEGMPANESVGLTMDELGCPAESRPAGAAGECYAVHYEPQHLNCTALELETDPDCLNGSTWVGMFFQSPMENWGEMQGTVVEAGATKVVFTAWTVEGELDLNFLAGGIGNLGTAYADTLRVEISQTITATPTQYEISLVGQSYEAVIAAFGWTIEKQGTDPVDFFLDDIRWVNE